MTHLPLDVLGDVERAETHPHVTTCARCRSQVSQQRAVRDLLASLPAPATAPPDVVLALGATLRDLAARPGVLPLQRRRRPAARLLLVGAAAAVTLVAGGGLLAQQLVAGGGSSSSAAGGAAELSTRGATTAGDQALTTYTRAGLGAQVTALLARAPLPGADRPLGTGLDGCLRALGVAGPPLALDRATFEGAPAVVVVLPAPGGGRDVRVVRPDCGPGAAGLIYQVTQP